MFLDGTLGGGGHTEAILERGDRAEVIGVDRDPDAVRAAGNRLARFGARFRAVRANFADAVPAAEIPPGSLAGALLDLGVSSHQIDVDDRGFTFRPGAPLDMRMAGATAGEATAAELLETLSERELAELFWRWGEERRSRRLARLLVEARERESLRTSDQLVDVIGRALGPASGPADRARIFQALRMAVNAEAAALEQALPRLRNALAPGGILAVLSYHSLEDRLVKHTFRDWSQRCSCPPALPICCCGGTAAGTLLTRKPVSASPEEVAANPRARSARLRGWRRA